MRRAQSPVKGSPPAQTLTTRANAALSQLQSLLPSSSNDEESPITIIRLSAPIISSASSSSDAPAARTSDISNTSLTPSGPTPSSLEADLLHYKELFSKLRFSYVEQVTKEKFIRAIVGDPPLIVTPQENAELEDSNKIAKAELKALKNEVADMVKDLESRGRELATKYEQVKVETVKLKELPAKIEHLERDISRLKREQQVAEGSKAELNLPLAKTLQLVGEKKRQMQELDRQLEQLRNQTPRKRKEMERLQGEVAGLEQKRVNATAAAKEAKRRKEDKGGRGGVDELEARGRWYRGSEAVLRGVLDIQG
ncbi:hypothetical protein QBC40DRAFT_339910 [Triangularia verruculosa]|uniref:Kinetochore protein Sos7 coiled-coil domain-containing protein n=1 Tax=Triangularia verruculosa TaxID=2587418 RepID=A0AAN6XGF5_9PEZI|nr:hypothetical protein QBC40DRAFT_339910 [Triangularia verruculosa]